MAISAAFAQPAPVKEPKLVEVSADGATLYFAGPLDMDAFVAFSRTLGKNPGVRQLVIASQGGEIRAGQFMASSVARRKLAVHVEHLCASACTLILLSAADRSIGPDAKIGFHKSYFVMENASPAPESGKSDGADGADSKIGSSRNRMTSAVQRGERYGDRAFRRIMETAGIDADFIERAVTTPSSEMWYPEPQLLLQSRVVTRLDAAPLPGGPSWAVDRETAGNGLGGPFWPVLKAKRPVLWTSKMSDVWRGRNAGVPATVAAANARSDVVGDLALDIAGAPDELLGRILAIHGAQAAQARKDEYRACRLSGGGMAGDEEADTYLLAEEDAALAELLQLRKLGKPLKPKKATRIVGAFAIENIATGKVPSDIPDLDIDCRDGLQAIETIAAAPPKQRLEVYRALMSLLE